MLILVHLLLVYSPKYYEALLQKPAVITLSLNTFQNCHQYRQKENNLQLDIEKPKDDVESICKGLL